MFPLEVFGGGPPEDALGFLIQMLCTLLRGMGIPFC